MAHVLITGSALYTRHGFNNYSGNYIFAEEVDRVLNRRKGGKQIAALRRILIEMNGVEFQVRGVLHSSVVHDGSDHRHQSLRSVHPPSELPN